MAYPSARVLLERYGYAAKKSWGQNFLVDAGVPDRIAATIGAGAGDVVLEIGAGLGHLTHALVSRGARVIAVERDREMVEVLRGELGAEPGVEILETNAMDLDLSAIAESAGGPLFVAGNLPYHISSQIVVHLLEARATWRVCLLMLQRELGERLVAPPGSRTYGALSVLVRAWTHARIAFGVPSSAFHPRPKVQSVMVRFDARTERAPLCADPRMFRWVVSAAFGQRRKTLRNAISHALVHGARGELAAPDAEGNIDTERLSAAFAKARVDPTLRAETLDVDDYSRLAEAIAETLGGPAREGSR
jgi:16S rRNA (adenine1518-N6/adenine1519-N6)-dimethyltransferase